MRRRDHHVEFGQHFIGQVQRTVFQDVDLDPTQQLDTSLAADHRDLMRLCLQPLGTEAVDDCDARRMVGDAQVLVAADARCLGHLEHAGAAVAPGRMGVEVAAIAGQVELAVAWLRRLAQAFPEVDQVAAGTRVDQLYQHPRDA